MKKLDFDEYDHEDLQDSTEFLDVEDFKKHTIKEKWERNRNKNGKSDTVYFRVTSGTLCKLFNRSKQTIFQWIKEKKFNPHDIQSIITFYINRS